MIRKMKKIIFVTRHNATDAQKALLKKMGYELEKTVNITFSVSEDFVVKLRNRGITSKTIALVAPTFVHMRLLNAGYIIIEFVNEPSKRAKGVFVCKGAFKSKLRCVPCDYKGDKWDAYIETDFYKCPISTEEQEEVSLN